MDKTKDAHIIEMLNKEIKGYIDLFPLITYPAKVFYPAYIGLSNLQEVNLGKNTEKGIIGEINIGILKRNINHKSSEKPFFINPSAHWNKLIYAILTNDEINNLDKAISLIEAKQDIRKAYKNIFETIHAEQAIDELAEKYLQREKENPSKDEFEHPLSETVFDLEYDFLLKFNTLKITNLKKTIFMNPDKRNELDLHDLEGKFDQKIPYEATIIRKIECM